MTLEETGAVMDVLRTAYPRFYGGPEAPDEVQTLKLWRGMFLDDDVAAVLAAVKCFIAEDQKGYAPSIGQIKNIMVRLMDRDSLDETQAWELLRRAAANSAYEARAEYERLPECVQSMCSPGQLYEWSQMDTDVFNSVVASHFQRSWRSRREDRRLSALLPSDVRRVLDGVAQRMALEA